MICVYFHRISRKDNIQQNVSQVIILCACSRRGLGEFFHVDSTQTLCQRYASKVLVCVTGCYVIANMEVGPISIYCLEASGGGANYHFLSSSNFEIFCPNVLRINRINLKYSIQILNLPILWISIYIFVYNLSIFFKLAY